MDKLSYINELSLIQIGQNEISILGLYSNFDMYTWKFLIMFHPDVYSLLLELENKVEPAAEMYEKALSHLRNRLDIETVWLRFVFSYSFQFQFNWIWVCDIYKLPERRLKPGLHATSKYPCLLKPQLNI